MKKIFLLLVMLGLWPFSVMAQKQTNPAIVGDSGSYNTSPQTCSAGQWCSLQTDINGNLKIISGSAGAGSFTPSAPSGSLTLTTGGTSQTLFTAGEVTNGCAIQNPATATEPIAVNFFTSASTTSPTSSMIIAVGAAISCPGGLTTAVSWVAATTSHVINAYKW